MKKFKSTIMREISLINEAETLVEVEKIIKEQVEAVKETGGKCILLQIEEVVDEIQDK